MELWFLDLIIEDDVTWVDKPNGKITRMKLRKNRRTNGQKKKDKTEKLFEKFNGDIEKVSKELRRGEIGPNELIFFGFNQREEVDQRF